MAKHLLIIAALTLLAGCKTTGQPKPPQNFDTTLPATAATKPADETREIYITRQQDPAVDDTDSAAANPPRVDLFKPGETPVLFLKNLSGKTVLITLEKIGEANPLLSSREVYIPQPWTRRLYNWGPLKNGSYNVTISTRDGDQMSVGFYVGDESDTTRLPISNSPSAAVPLFPANVRP